MNDIIYYFEKRNGVRHGLGELQVPFNQSYVLDGTKDSAKVNIISLEYEEEIEPNTIVFHPNTNSWWIVDNDKVEKYVYETGYIYKHTMQLLGAIELLNARDLTDCGFYQNKYTIREFFFRLLKLSNFEYLDQTYLFTNGLLDTNQIVDYIKTFENYTLLSAIRELFDAYNINVKLEFRTNNRNIINEARFVLYSKSGNVNNVVDLSTFNNVKETRTMDRNSFATSVVSNAENVISTKEKTYPSVGGVKATGTQYQITPSTAVIRLPSNINKLNWIRLYKNSYVNFSVVVGTDSVNVALIFNQLDDSSIENAFLTAYDSIQSLSISSAYKTAIINDIEEHKEEIIRLASLGSRTTFYSGRTYNPTTNLFEAPKDNADFYQPYFIVKGDSSTIPDETYTGQVGIVDKDTRDNISYPISCFYYERGKNTISGLNMLKDNSTLNHCYPSSFASTDLKSDYYDTYNIYRTQLGQNAYYEARLVNSPTVSYSISTTRFVINYVPMSDLKIKLDNDADRHDIHLYNQNGRLNDSVALSKQLLAYTKEIQSNTITKYGTFFDFNRVPKVGSVCYINNDLYVIGNVSLDFAQNEEDTYFISGEFTMSKYIATKSQLTNPNTNIRDYGIPQNNNVARKQLYRDFYELAHEEDIFADSEKYMGLDSIVNFGSSYKDTSDHTGVIKLSFKNKYGNANNTSDTYYYQLDTTTYILKKSLYQVINFNDNNIIGYGSQNAYSGFDIRRVFSGMTDCINTPISYVDDNGEFKDIEIAFCTNEQLTSVYQNYVERMKEETGLSYGESLFNYSVFIPKEIYEGNGTYETETFTHNDIVVANKQLLTLYQIKINLKQYGFLPQDFNDDINSLTITNISATYGATQLTFGNAIISKDSYGNYILTALFNTNLNYNELEVVLNMTIEHKYIEYVSDNGAKDNCDFIIAEKLYNKDPIEVPVFEYSFQIDDSNDVIIGSNILDTKPTDLHYFYQVGKAPKGTINDNNFGNVELGSIEYNSDLNALNVENVISFNVEDNKLHLTMHNLQQHYLDNSQEDNLIGIVDIEEYLNDEESGVLVNKDLVIVRVVPIIENNIITYKKDLMFVVRNTDKADYQSGTDMYLTINHYKLS